MGTSESRHSICPYCGTELDLRSIDINSNNLICGRCHGSIKKIQPKRSRIPSFLTSSTNNVIKSPLNKRALTYLHIAPFADDIFNVLRDEEKQNISDHYIINNLFKPYFNKHRDIMIKAGNRLIIKDIEFKIISCYPPNGFVDIGSTLFYLNDNDDELLTLKSRPIKQIHLLPTISSLNAENKISNLEIHRLNGNDLYEERLKPYLSGDDDNLFILNNNNNNNKRKQRHLMNGEIFIYKGIEWRVMKCQPFDGFINLETTVYCNGRPLNDIKTIHIRPKYESLPDIHKNWSSQQIQQYYLYPLLYGRYKYFDIDNLNDLKINNIDFIIHSMQPNKGIITCSTLINSTPIKSAEIIHIQQQQDLEFAHRLQQQEYDNILSGRNMVNQMALFQALQQMDNNNNNNNNNQQQREQMQQQQENNNYPAFYPVAGPFVSFAQLTARLHELQSIERMRREPVGLNQQLINTLPTYKYSIKVTKGGGKYTDNGDNGENTENIDDNIDNMDNTDNDKDKDDEIIKTETTTTRTKGSDEDDISCRICLEEYEDGEEIKILPCFHKYHKMCIDNWLKHSIKCPICTTSIFE